VNFNTIQKELFDLTIVVSKTDVQKEVNRLKAIDDYHQAIASVAIRSSHSLNDFIRGKR